MELPPDLHSRGGHKAVTNQSQTVTNGAQTAKLLSSLVTPPLNFVGLPTRPLRTAPCDMCRNWQIVVVAGGVVAEFHGASTRPPSPCGPRPVQKIANCCHFGNATLEFCGASTRPPFHVCHGMRGKYQAVVMAGHTTLELPGTSTHPHPQRKPHCCPGWV